MPAVLTFEDAQPKGFIPKQVVGLTAVLMTGAALTPMNIQAVQEVSGIVSKVNSQPQEGFVGVDLDSATNVKAVEEKEFTFSICSLSIIEAQLEVQEMQEKLTSLSLQWQGIPYRWGGRTKTGVDCSGLVQRIYLENGIQLPRTSYEQFKVGVGIPKAKLQPGDLVFFTTNGAGASHVGIYLESGKFISATKNRVEVQSLDDPYWAETYRGSRRVIGELVSKSVK